RPTSPPADSTSTSFRTSSILTCRRFRKITCTVSAGPAVRARKEKRFRWSRGRKRHCSRASKNCSNEASPAPSCRVSKRDRGRRLRMDAVRRPSATKTVRGRKKRSVSSMPRPRPLQRLTTRRKRTSRAGASAGTAAVPLHPRSMIALDGADLPAEHPVHTSGIRKDKGQQDHCAHQQEPEAHVGTCCVPDRD